MWVHYHRHHHHHHRSPVDHHAAWKQRPDDQPSAEKTVGEVRIQGYWWPICSDIPTKHAWFHQKFSTINKKCNTMDQLSYSLRCNMDTQNGHIWKTLKNHILHKALFLASIFNLFGLIPQLKLFSFYCIQFTQKNKNRNNHHRHLHVEPRLQTLISASSKLKRVSGNSWGAPVRFATVRHLRGKKDDIWVMTPGLMECSIGNLNCWNLKKFSFWWKLIHATMFFWGNLSYEARSHSISPHHINFGYLQVTHGKTPSARSCEVNSTLKYIPDQYHLVL